MPNAWPHRTPALYVHVPFCAQKCSYCAFYSEASSGPLIQRYVHSLVRELELVAPDLKPHSIFFGGGTPSLLTLQQWEQILRTMEQLGLTAAQEWTVECNPATISLDKARLLRSYGVNRISMGVQSLDEALLDRLGRVHSRQMVFKSFDILRQAGFDNVNLDLMFAIPGQTMETWRSTLREAIALGSEHLSAYEVIYEDDTPLFAQLKAGEFDVDDELACDMYEELVNHAEGAGLRQYEVANFARDIADCGLSRSHRGNEVELATNPNPPPHVGGYGTIRNRQSPIPSLACRHNLNYWRGGSFYGLGPSATGYVRGVRTKNWSNTHRYCELLESGNRAVESREELSPLARAGETAAFGLRVVAGWPFEEFQAVTGHDLRSEWSNEMHRLTEQGWGRIEPDRFQLTRQGLRFADAAAELFLR